MKIRNSRALLSTLIFAGMLVCGTTSTFAQGDQVAKNAAVNVTDSAAGDSDTTTTADSTSTASPSSPMPEKPTLTRVGVHAAQPIPLSINDAIRKALENNNAIEITRDDVRFQETQIRSIIGLYDPVFNFNPTFNRNSTTGSAATNDLILNSNITHFIKPGGGNYQFFYNSTRTENAFTQAQVSSGQISGGGSSAIYSASMGVRYTQPLFRNFKVDNTRRNLKVARRRLEQTDADFRRQTIDTIAQVQRTYWDLVFALRDQQNRQANLELTRENLRQAIARIDAGAAAPLSRWEVETELANRESELLLATQQVAITENALKQLILKDATSAEWLETYVPTDRPALTLDTVNLDAAISDAMDNRYELRRLKLSRDINAIDLEYFKNQTKPQIDLNTTFSLDGLAQGGASIDPVLVPRFTGNDAIIVERLNTLLPLGQRIINDPLTIPGTPRFLAGGFGQTFVNIFRNDAPNFSVGLTISFPFRNRTAEANLAGARVQQSQLEAQLRAEEQVVIVQVRNAVQAVETARQRVLAARRARENAEKQLEGERKLFDSGKSTTFFLFQRENALTNARNAEIRSETDYNKAIADLQQATSTTFQMNNIEIESPTNGDNK